MRRQPFEHLDIFDPCRTRLCPIRHARGFPKRYRRGARPTRQLPSKLPPKTWGRFENRYRPSRPDRTGEVGDRPEQSVNSGYLPSIPIPPAATEIRFLREGFRCGRARHFLGRPGPRTKPPPHGTKEPRLANCEGTRDGTLPQGTLPRWSADYVVVGEFGRHVAR